MKQILKWTYYILLIPICFEIALLLFGYNRYLPVEYTITSTPTYCLSSDSSLGFALNPGQFKVTINKGLTYSVSHTKDSIRTIPFKYNDTANMEVYFMGCSYTYGMGVNDDENFPALIQKEFPDIKVKNLAIPGFGTVQSYLQLKRLLKNDNLPEILIVNYADFHDMRNALTPYYRENLKTGFENSSKNIKTLMTSSKLPFVTKNKNQYSIHYCEWNNIYENWMFRDVFASVNYLQLTNDELKDKAIPKKEITHFLFEEINQLCIENEIKLLVTGITQNENTKSTLDVLKKKGIETLDISINLNSTLYNNMPYDSHPNKLTHRIWAEKISHWLKTTLKK